MWFKLFLYFSLFTRMFAEHAEIPKHRAALPLKKRCARSPDVPLFGHGRKKSPPNKKGNKGNAPSGNKSKSNKKVIPGNGIYRLPALLFSYSQAPAL